MKVEESIDVGGRIKQESALKSFVRENLSTLSIAGVFILICLFFGFMTDTFLSFSNSSNIIIQIAPNIIVAVMMTFVITTGGIDLSVGSILALASALAATLLSIGAGSFVTLISVIAAGLLVGLVNGYVVAYHGIPPLIVTLASMIYVRGLALMITGGYSIAIMGEDWIVSLGQDRILGVPIPVFLSVFIVTLGIVFLRYTRYGNYVTGIGANEESVRRSGVSTKKVKLITYMLSGGSAALAGLIIAARLGSGSSNIGNMFELDIIAAVVLGGTALFGGAGTIIGSVIGVALIGVIQNGLTLMHVSPYIIQIVEGFVLLLAVIINIRVFGKKS
ncbi:ABC transporter permease [Salinibacillus xinjiangensis]|uniref:ABC transporter permease n=1 Tax=Salinibacillus xinjiangensis TaxID=1229268 RepID=A0A6G1XAV5_9BACI|nr:ABC transporter permease [Salinibacillus xinjiangensis]MRG88143.1 ABC transporter permease [Salinibacillus xinjiangensis]